MYKNLLVTGGCGFIGANFIRYLLEESDFTGRIINIDNLTYAGNPDNLSGIEEGFPDRYQFDKIDICDKEEVAKHLINIKLIVFATSPQNLMLTDPLSILVHLFKPT